MHANAAETSAILAINPQLVDMEKANAEFPPFPSSQVNTGAGAHGVLLHGARFGLLGDEVWHVGRRAEVDAGDWRALLEAGVGSTIAVLENIEKMFEAMPPR